MVDKKSSDYLYQDSHSNPTAFSHAVGGTNQTWKEILQNLGQIAKYNQHLHYGGEVMGDLEYVRKFNRLNCPIQLNPQESTFDDVALHGILRQRLSYSTVEKNLRYARFMETHQVPVNFRELTYENFIRHMDFRESIENIGFGALKGSWQAVRMFLRAYGIPEWDYKLPYAPRSHPRNLPFPDVVNGFFKYRYFNDEYQNALFQYMFTHSFMIGWRAPSEIVAMTVDDVIIDNKGRGCLNITETKKHRQKRTILPEKSILSSRVHKSFKNWIDHWRPKVENQYSSNVLYLQESGKPFTVRHLGHKLSILGKQIWPSFQPYDMRHWCAVARLIKSKIETNKFDVYTVQNWLGHTDIKTTQNYIQFAEMYYHQDSVDWIAEALKSRFVRGKLRHKTNVAKNQQNPILGPVAGIFSEKRERICRYLNKVTEGISINRTPFLALLIFRASQSISLKPFFFFFIFIQHWRGLVE